MCIRDSLRTALSGLRRAPEELPAPIAMPAEEPRSFEEPLPTVQGKLCMLFTPGEPFAPQDLSALRVAVALLGGTPTSVSYTHLISEVIDDLVAENPLGRENWDRAAANDYLYNGGLRIYSTVDTEVQTALENVWLEGKYWEPMPIENYVDPNKPDDTPHTITTQAAGVVINYKGELCGVVGGLGQKTENRGFNRGTEMERQVGSTMKAVAAYPLGIDMDLINYSSCLLYTSRCV